MYSDVNTDGTEHFRRLSFTESARRSLFVYKPGGPSTYKQKYHQALAYITTILSPDIQILTLLDRYGTGLGKSIPFEGLGPRGAV